MNIQVFVDKIVLVCVPDDFEACRSRGLFCCLYAVT